MRKALDSRVRGDNRFGMSLVVGLRYTTLIRPTPTGFTLDLALNYGKGQHLNQAAKLSNNLGTSHLMSHHIDL